MMLKKLIWVTFGLLIISLTATTLSRDLMEFQTEFSFTSLVLASIFAILTVWRQYSTQRQNRFLSQQTDTLETEIHQLQKNHKAERERLAALLSSGRLAYWEWHIKDNTAYFSDLCQEMIGLAPQEQNNDLHAWQDRIHPADQKRVQNKLLKLLGNQQNVYEDSHRIQHQNGHYIWVYDRGMTTQGEGGEIEKLTCVRFNITEQKQNEEELALDRVLLDSAREAIAIADKNRKLVRTNPAFHQMFAIQPHELAKFNLDILLNQLQDEQQIDVFNYLAAQNEWQGELVLHHADGQLAKATLVDVQKIHHQTTQQTHFAVIFTDITELKSTQKELDILANIDPVTQLPNRNYFYKELKSRFQQAVQQQKKFTLMFLDLDNFKIVNDTLGHDAGDQLLKSVSDLISEQLADETLLARVGGDEFVILCQQYTTQEQLEQVGSKLNELLATPFKLGEHDIQIGSSIGMAIYPDHADTTEELLKKADIAMYKAKTAGKGQSCIYQKQTSL